jgi:hypothetical protein
MENRMRSWKPLAIVLTIFATLGWAVSSAQVQSVPGPGTGVVTVTGEVGIANKPTVLAMQQGDWHVSLAGTTPVSVTNTPSVALALPFTPKNGARYEIVWPTGERENIVVMQGAAGAWVRVERNATTGERWVNLAGARAVSELR